MTETKNTDAALLSPMPLMSEAWRQVPRAAGPSALWLAALCVAAGVYGAATQMQAGWIALGALAAVFAAGVEASRRIYGAMMGRRGHWKHLAHTNLAIYVVFAFVGVFVGFFLSVLPGIFLMVAGTVDMTDDPKPEIVQAALRDLVLTPYGALYGLLVIIGGAGMCILAVRLIIAGASTVHFGQPMVFRTWPETKGHVLPLAIAALGTHVAPFLIAMFAGYGVQMLIGGQGSAAMAFLTSAIGMALLVPFILSGHGLAAVVFKRLYPPESV